MQYNGDKIWVTEGVYKPSTPADLRNVTITEREASCLKRMREKRDIQIRS